jgi:hypothetical protein
MRSAAMRRPVLEQLIKDQNLSVVIAVDREGLGWAA